MVFPSTQLKAGAASYINYACVHWAYSSTSKGRGLLDHLYAGDGIHRAIGRVQRKELENRCSRRKQTATLLQFLVGGAERSPQAITQSGAKICVRDTRLPLPMTHPPSLNLGFPLAWQAPLKPKLCYHLEKA